jgi:DtxR family Mn-dependent transcriptional regulator
MYLKSMFQLGADQGPVAISALAEHLGISPVSATEMVHRMVKERLVEHIPYKGVSLTERGKQRALAVLRRHRLWERFLTDRLGLPWEQVHDVACQLEHSVGPEVTEPLAEDLGQPDTCPHGNPIPSAEGKMPAAAGLKLHQLRVGQRGVVDVIRPEKGDILEYLSSHGVTPGTEVEILEIEPLDGARLILVGSQQVAVGRELAEYVQIRVLAPSRDDVALR